MLTLSVVLEDSATTEKALERRAERGTLHVARRGAVRVVAVDELVRVGLVAPGADVTAPTGPGAADRPLAVLARRVAEADADLAELRAALSSTEAALRRAREDARQLRSRLAHGAAPEALAETA